MSVRFNLVSDVRNAILHNLDAKKHKNKTHPLRSVSTVELLTHYLNWRSRFINPQPRHVYISDSIERDTIYQKRRNEVDMLLKKLEDGVDVTPHLSKRVLQKYREHNSYSNNPKHLDFLLNEWGIHHLHVNSKIKSDGFVEQDDDLLYLIVTDKIVYALTVQGHGYWNNKNLVDIAYRNWPSANLFIKIQGIVGMENENITEQENQKLRSHGFSMITPVNGNFFVSRTGGVQSSGVASNIPLKAKRIYEELKKLDKDARPLINSMKNIVISQKQRWPSGPRIKICFSKTKKLVILEEISGAEYDIE